MVHRRRRFTLARGRIRSIKRIMKKEKWKSVQELAWEEQQREYETYYRHLRGDH